MLNILQGKHIWTMNLETLQLKHHTWENTSNVPETIFSYIYVLPIIVSYHFKWFYGYMCASYCSISCELDKL